MSSKYTYLAIGVVLGLVVLPRIAAMNGKK